jgi:type II secretory pathway pseudopilin PulG
MTCKPDKEAGFTLVETLVAFIVLAAGAVGILLGLQTAVRASNEALAREHALEMAEMLLWQAREGDPDELVTTGEAAQGLSWTRSITPLAANPNVLRIDVRVPWRSGHEEKQVELVTYRRGYDDDE